MAKLEEESVYRQLKILTALTAVLLTNKDFADYTQQKQIGILGKLGLRNKELSEIFGVTPQQVNNALAKTKRKK